MKLKHIISIFLFTISLSLSVPANGQSFRQMHKSAHENQLANAKNAIDKRVIEDFINNDIIEREALSENNNIYSPEIEELVNDLLSEARSHLGKRYRRGSKGPNAFDCSGFSSYVYRQFGYNLGASSRDQYNQGEKIEVKDLRKGDLVFFTGRNRAGGVGHVGIVTEVDTAKGSFKFIHASTSQGIKIDSNIGYYEGRYLGARRIIED